MLAAGHRPNLLRIDRLGREASRSSAARRRWWRRSGCRPTPHPTCDREWPVPDQDHVRARDVGRLEAERREIAAAIEIGVEQDDLALVGQLEIGEAGPADRQRRSDCRQGRAAGRGERRCVAAGVARLASQKAASASIAGNALGARIVERTRLRGASSERPDDARSSATVVANCSVFSLSSLHELVRSADRRAQRLHHRRRYAGEVADDGLPARHADIAVGNAVPLHRVLDEIGVVGGALEPDAQRVERRGRRLWAAPAR